MPTLFYDPRDDVYHEKRESKILYWLDDLGAKPLDEAKSEEPGFLFTGARSMDDYEQLIQPYPNLRDRPQEREPLLVLDKVLSLLAEKAVSVPMPETWNLPLDEPLPDDIRFPVFVRTAQTSWKLGGHVSRANNPTELLEEAESLRRAIQWDALILAREWLDLEPAGPTVYGTTPQEIRVWIVDQVPVAWSFHHIHLVPDPDGFPPPAPELAFLKQAATEIASVFTSRCVVADFAKQTNGVWAFIEAGPGSCAGTACEETFKGIASRLQEQPKPIRAGRANGPL